MSRKLILASAMTMALAGTDVSALGLGGLRTQSALNQPFLGEIELRDLNANEVDTVKASIASQEAFAKAGVERYYYLTRLKLTPEVSAGGKPVIRISSKDPVREPYMDFLVEVVWPSGKLIKEYTVLLDPPTLSRQAAPAVRSARADSAAASARPASAASAVRSGSYISAPGEGFPIYAGPIGNGRGLWSVAREVAPANATVAQTAMALYRNNQGAFIRGNINRLIAGKTLVIPSSGELFALDASAAEREYVAALRGRAQYLEPLTEVTPDMLASHLRVSGAAQPGRQGMPASAAGALPGAAPTAAGSQQDLMLALETSESTRQETVELRGRIKQLETQLADIQSLLRVRDEALARMQDTPAGAEVGQPPVADPTAVPAQPAVADAQPPGPEVALNPDTVTADPAVVAVPETATEDSAETGGANQEAVTAPGLIPVPTPVPATTAVVEGQAEVSPAEPALDPVPAASSAPPPAAAVDEDSSTWHSLLLPLAGLAGVTALGIAGFSWAAMRRRREEEELELSPAGSFYDALEATTEPRSSMMADEKDTLSASTRIGEEPLSVPVSTQRPEGEPDSGITLMSSLTSFDAETDEADVLSEADIYIAYGRFSEAQELLKNEAQRYPERLDIKLKLAEAFAGSRDLDALSSIMGEIRASGGDAHDPAQWERLQSLLTQLQTGGSAPGDAAGKVPIVAGTAASDPMTLDLGDSFSLDISDLQRTSGQPQGSEMLGDLTLDGSTLTKISTLDAGKDSGIESALGSIALDGDSFGDAMTVAVKRRGQESELRAGREDSELELTLEEHRVEDVDDFDSIFDSGVVHEPTLARNELDGARPTGPDVPSRSGSSTTDSSEAGLPPDQESVPTDLLSSQWQIDSGIWDETATKLDLARAYIEMDDKDAAREILEEVISEGRDEQKNEAQALLDTLS